MRSPLRSASLAEFWNRRWNTAFNTLANQLAFRPLARRLNARRAILAVFLISGLIHELVISVPARGGYGLPTLYFLIQGIGVLFERRRRNRALTENLKPNVSFRRFLPGRRVKRWLFMAAFTALPVPLLFHPPFIHHVILPMVHFLGTRFRSL
jgi:alginate O-acetyltransferase complex protein AlgI